jgi:large subunit ribosomal protein L3
MASCLLQKQASGMAFRSSLVPHKARFAQTQLATRVQRRTIQVNARQKEVDVGIFGTKAGMMSWFTADGLCVPATVIALEPGNIVTAVKTEATDGYNAVQVGYKIVAERKVSKPELGHLAKSGCPPVKHLREFRVRLAAAGVT